MDELFKTVLLFGGPGVGKGTQGRVLGNIPGFFHCATGDLFRKLNPHSKLGRIFKDYSNRGELVPDAVTINLWSESMKAYAVLGDYQPQRDMLVLDGIPRTVEQAKIMEPHIQVLQIVFLTAKDQDIMIDRLRRRALSEGRDDDADENVIRHRWEVYEEETCPILEYYPAELVQEVDAVGSPGEVLQRILSVVAPVQVKHFRQFTG